MIDDNTYGGTTIYGYYDRRYYGLAESAHLGENADVAGAVWEYISKGYYVELFNLESGDVQRFSPDDIEDPYDIVVR